MEIIIPETLIQNLSPNIWKNGVNLIDVWSNKVNTNTDATNDNVMIINSDLFLDVADVPKIIGSTGSTQGDKTVRSPAINAAKYNVILRTDYIN